MTYSVKRSEIVDAARELLGTPYRHQGRSRFTGVDCVGLLVLIGEAVKHPEIHDLSTYRRMPDTKTFLKFLRRNLNGIKLKNAGLGDFVVMRMPGGEAEKHVAVISNTETDLVHGIEPTVIHALSNGAINRVIEQPMRLWEKNFMTAFRVKYLAK